jgi:hypothetical protein
MVRASALPAWAPLIVEAARLLREAGWLASPTQDCSALELPPPVEFPACAPLLACPAVSLGQWSIGLALAADRGIAFGFCIVSCGYGRPRAAPSRRGGPRDAQNS